MHVIKLSPLHGMETGHRGAVLGYKSNPALLITWDMLWENYPLKFAMLLIMFYYIKYFDFGDVDRIMKFGEKLW